MGYVIAISIVTRFKPVIGLGVREPHGASDLEHCHRFGVLVLFIVVIGGIYVGILPSEAGAIGACGAFFALLRGTLTWRSFLAF